MLEQTITGPDESSLNGVASTGSPPELLDELPPELLPDEPPELLLDPGPPSLPATSVLLPQAKTKTGAATRPATQAELRESMAPPSLAYCGKPQIEKRLLVWVQLGHPM